jgi:hypothetical protein
VNRPPVDVHQLPPPPPTPPRQESTLRPTTLLSPTQRTTNSADTFLATPEP